MAVVAKFAIAESPKLLQKYIPRGLPRGVLLYMGHLTGEWPFPLPNLENLKRSEIMRKKFLRTLSVVLAIAMFISITPLTSMALIDEPIGGQTGSGWDALVPDVGNLDIFDPHPTLPPSDFDTGRPDNALVPQELPPGAIPDWEFDFGIDGFPLSPADPDADYGFYELPPVDDTPVVDDPYGLYPPTDEPPDGEAEYAEVAARQAEVNDNAFVLPVSSASAAAFLAWLGAAESASSGGGNIDWSMNFTAEFALEGGETVSAIPQARWAQHPGDGHGVPFFAGMGSNLNMGAFYTASPASDNRILELLVQYETGGAGYAATQMAILSVGDSGFRAWGAAGDAWNRASGTNTSGWALYRWSASGSGQSFYTVRNAESEDEIYALDDMDFETPIPTGNYRYEVRYEYRERIEIMPLNQVSTFTITEARGHFFIDKVDQDGRPLNGAEFHVRIQFADGSYQLRYVEANESGSVEVTYRHPDGDTAPATITVRETRAPMWYEHDPNPRTFTVSPSYNRVTIVTSYYEEIVHRALWRVVVRIDGAVEVECECPDDENDNSECDVDITITILADYIVREFETSHNKLPADVNETVSTQHGDQNVRVRFVNTRELGQLTVFKRCAVTGHYLQGAEFRVQGMNLPGGRVFNQTGTTGPGGYVVFNGLFPGSYQVTEINAPPTHNLDAPPQTTTIQSNESVRLTFNNTRRQGLSILKVDEHGNPLAGAVFEVIRGNGHVVGSFSTNSNGLIIVPNHYLTTGHYTVREIQAPEGFLIDDENNPQTIFIDNTQQTPQYQLTFRNFRMPGIEIIKVDGDTGNRLADAAFRIANSITGQTWDVRTDANGRAYLPGLELNTTYIVTEIQAPPGFVRSNYRHELVLRENRTHTITVENFTEPSVRIMKRDRATGLLLPGAAFRIALSGGLEYQEVTTDINGIATVTGLQPGTYTITEVRAPTGFILDETPRTFIVNEGEHHTFVIYNDRAPSIEIIKISTHDGRRLPDAGFRISWNNGAYFRDVVTNAQGIALLTDLEPGWFTITETRAPDGHILDTTPTQVYLQPGERRLVTISNEAYPSLTIDKICSVTANPLEHARFRIERVTDTGISLVGEFTTNAEGRIHLPLVEVGRFRITEVDPPPGFIVDVRSREVTIAAGQNYQLTITNTPRAPILIRKVDPQGNPLLGAEFTITTMNGGHVATVQSSHTGYALVPNVQPGWYIVRETRAPSGFVLSNTPQTVEVFAGRPATVTFVNHAMPILQIAKVDADSGAPLIGATFRVTEATGSYAGEHTTNAEGLVVLDHLPPGTYIVSEIRAPEGFILDMTPQTVVLQAGRVQRLEFRNVGIPGLQLVKLCSETGNPIEGARFEVVRLTGAARTTLGTFTTGTNGTFFIPALEPGNYVITETHAAPGFFLDSTPQNVFVSGGRINMVQVFNTPYSNLRINKICSETRTPLEGAIFRLFDERRVEVGTFTTSALGEIFLTELPAGTYFLQEIRAPQGFAHDSTIRQIELIGGRTTTVEWPNIPLGSLRIVKVDADTRAPIYGVTFELLNASGASLGRFRTDQNGVIAFSSNLTPGRYQIREIQAAPGYELDPRIHSVVVTEGETLEVIFENTRLGSLRIIKECAVTRDRLSGARFIISDDRNNLISEHVTDENGVVFLPHSFATGRFYIRETRAPDGFILDDRARAVDIRAGHTAEIVVTNTPMRGNIQIVKVSDSHNDITRQASGARLAGAVFQIFDDRLNLVDEITTDRNGVAISIDLPLGRYAVREVRAPRYFVANSETIYVDIRVHEDLVRLTVENSPEQIAVNVVKRGIVEALRGDTIVYEFSGIANNSNVELNEFFWRDTLPTDAVRVVSLNTGTWSHRGTYEVWVQTNLRGWARVRSNLHTNVEYTIDLSPGALRLAANEFVTETKLMFGTVPAGFESTVDPFIRVRVNDDLPNGFMFVNRTDVGGRTGNEWVYDRCSWVSTVFGPGRTGTVSRPDPGWTGGPRNLPRTGGPGFAQWQADFLAELYNR